MNSLASSLQFCNTHPANFAVKSVISKSVGALTLPSQKGPSGQQEVRGGWCKGSFNIFGEKSQLVCGFDLLLITSSLNQN